MQIVLASRSPRRKKALRQIISRFRTLAVPEPKKAKGKSLVAKTRYLALAKAKAAGKRFPRAVVIAADTLACCRGLLMKKASSQKEAAGMLKRMSGQRLDVVTSIALKRPAADFVVWSEYGWVRFRMLKKDEIARYARSGAWQGKAAAVNVEEKPVRNWIEKNGGEFGAVVGLPTKKLRARLRQMSKII
ncbi:MAG: Maf family protein [Candidatus Marsarchaeota archaeon]|nr:Maf family protein [Candidatus Marsarchaeota archaeon]